MSITLFSLAAAAAPMALQAISDFARQNRGTFNAILKESKPAIREVSKKIDDTVSSEVNKYKDDGWKKE